MTEVDPQQINPVRLTLVEKAEKDANVIALGVVFPNLVDASQEEIRRLLDDVEARHRNLDKALDELQTGTSIDMLQVTRMKRAKLVLKDHAQTLKAKLLPDILA